MYGHFPFVSLDSQVALGYKECIFIITLMFYSDYINPPSSEKKLVSEQLTSLRFMKVMDRNLSSKAEL